jgi:iron complex outermembrane receptor protein
VNDPVYGDNRIGGIPLHVYEAELMYEAPCGFYAGPNIQANLTSYPVDQKDQYYANAYWLLGFKIGYASQWKKLKYQVFVEAKNLNNEIYATSVDPFPGENAGDPPPQVYHPGDRRSFYGGLALSW